MAVWFDLTMQQIDNDHTYDDIIDKFQQMQLDKKFEVVFLALKGLKQKRE